MTDIHQIPVGRLRQECVHLGISHTGMSRAELITELRSKGMETIDLRFAAKPPKIDTSNRKDDLSNVFIGNGSGKYEVESNRLYISNTDTTCPLIYGKFDEKQVKIHDVFNIAHHDFDASLCGEEGDLRRCGSELYMYRTTDVLPGWYPLRFGPLKII